MEKEQFIAELKALAKELKSQGLSNEEIQIQLDAKKAEYKKVKTTPVVSDAIAGEEIASDMELPSDPGSLDLPEVPKQFGNELEGISLDEIRKNTKEAEKIKTDDIYNRIGSNAFAGSVEEKVEIFNAFGKEPKLVEAGIPGFVETKIQNDCNRNKRGIQITIHISLLSKR